VFTNQTESIVQKALSRFHPVPWRGTGWVRKRNEIEAMSCEGTREFLPDDVVKSLALEELRDGQLADGDN